MNTSVAVVSSSYYKSITPVTVFTKYRHSHPSSAVPGLTNKAFSCSFGNTNKNDIVEEIRQVLIEKEENQFNYYNESVVIDKVGGGASSIKFSLEID